MLFLFAGYAIIPQLYLRVFTLQFITYFYRNENLLVDELTALGAEVSKQTVTLYVLKQIAL